MPTCSLEVTEPRCEYAQNPLGIDAKIPRLSWILRSSQRAAKQGAFRILVADSSEELSLDLGNIWDSGKVPSGRSFSVEYAGTKLESRKRYFWKVRVWDDRDNPSEFSEPCWWEMGLLHAEDWKAKWIEGGGSFFTSFSLQRKPVKARAYVACIGYYELWINDEKVGDRVLDPAPSAHDKRVFYATCELENFLSAGKNSVQILVGKARQTRNLVLAQVEAAEDNKPSILVGTDENWATSTKNPIVYDDLYDGEIFDARLEDSESFHMSHNSRARIADSSTFGNLASSASFPPIRVTGSMKAVAMEEPRPLTYVFDFGQNFSGWASLHVRGDSGSKVTLRYSEILNPDGTIHTGTNRVAKSTDVYVLNGSRGVYEPHFTYHGFRYVEVTGFPGVPTIDSLEGKVVHTNVETTGSFLCSNDLVNKIHRMAVWSQISNLMGIPTDSPQRDERLGWLQDAMLSAEEAIMNFGMCGFYEKLLNDISDSQKEDGSLPDVIPSYGERYPADSSCGAAYLAIAYLLYLFYGDTRILEEHYESMKKWVGFEATKSSHHILNLSKYGDWCSPAHVKPIETPGELISTFWFYHNSQRLSEMAFILGKTADGEKFRDLSLRIREAFNAKFLAEREDREYAHAERYKFFGYGLSQTCNILPLYADMVPDDKLGQVIAGLVQDVGVSRDGHLNTGIIGTRFLFHTLSKYGYPELAYRVLTQTSYPSYGHMIKEGATTLWERWEYLTGVGMNSHNHIMFGSVDGWLYDTIGGIYPDSPGFSHFTIRPFVPEKLECASTSLSTVSGLIVSNWRKIEESGKTVLVFEVTVPANSSATVFIPRSASGKSILYEGKSNLFEMENSISDLPDGIFRIFARNNYFECEVGSGTYNFKLRNHAN